MSTAGKVLSVLVTLLAAVWVLLAAGVTQLNRNGTSAVEKLQKQFIQLEQEVAKTQREVAVLTDDAFNEKLRTQNEVTRQLAAQAEVEKARSTALETAARVKLQLTRENATLAAAQADSKQRKAEFAAETQAIADAEALVEKLRGENTTMLGQLSGLREKLRQSLEANKQKVERMLRAGDPPTRPASSTR